jgi:hypothetical protein
MDALILRAALLLCVPVSAVVRMQATDVLALSVAAMDRDVRRSQARTLATIESGYVMNAAILAPESLKQMEQSARRAAGHEPKATPLPAALEAQLAALPLAD